MHRKCNKVTLVTLSR